MKVYSKDVFVLETNDGCLYEKRFYDSYLPVLFDSEESALAWLTDKEGLTPKKVNLLIREC